MEKDTKDLWLKILGILFILFSSWSFVNQLFSGEPYGVLWFCYIGLFLMGIGCLVNTRELILAQVYLLFIPVLVWDLDFFWLLFSGDSLFGITNYFFSLDHTLFDKIISMQHLLSIPLGIFACALAQPRQLKTIRLLAIEIVTVFSLTAIFSSRDANINCIFSPCFALSLPGPYLLWWFLGVFASSLLVFGVHKVLTKKN